MQGANDQWQSEPDQTGQGNKFQTVAGGREEGVGEDLPDIVLFEREEISYLQFDLGKQNVT